MSYDPAELTKHVPSPMEAIKDAIRKHHPDAKVLVVQDDPALQRQVRQAEAATLVEAHAAATSHRRVLGRIPLYAKALGALRALVVAGGNPRDVGEVLPWPKEFAPLNLEEKQVVRARFLEQLAKAEATRS